MTTENDTNTEGTTEPPVTLTNADDTQRGADTAGGADTQGDTGTGGETTVGNDSVSGGETIAGNDSVAPLTADSYADLTAPEGLVVDDTLMASAKFIFAEAGVKPSEAPKLLGLYKDALTAQATALQTAASEAFTTMSTTWQRETLALPEFTGSSKDTSLATIARVIDQFGPNGVREVLDATGAGNNPALLQMLLKIGNTLNEGQPTRTGQPAASGRKLSYAEKMYGDKT